MAARFIGVVAAVVFTATVLLGQPQLVWEVQEPRTLPLVGPEPRMAFDPVSGTILLFGTGSETGDAETWLWDGSDWTLQVPASSPSARSVHAMTFHGGIGRVILFGGRGAGAVALQDTWSWDGASWEQLSPATSPPGRGWHSMVYDVQRDRIVLFGGFRDVPFGYFGDTWEFDGTDWTEVVPTGAPGARAHHAMAYDPARGVTVLFGGHANGSRFRDTWEFDSRGWTRQLPVTSPLQRAHHHMEHDPVQETIVLLWGWESGYLSDAWAWDGEDWTEMEQQSPPSPMDAGTVAHDTTRNTFVAFVSSGASGRTWLGEPFPSGFATFGAGCEGSAGIPEISVVDMPRVGQRFGVRIENLAALQLGTVVTGFSSDSWDREGLALPQDLGFLGFPGCLLLVSPDFQSLAGSSVSGVAEWGFAIPDAAVLYGVEFFNQAFFVDSVDGQVTVVGSNAGRATIGF